MSEDTKDNHEEPDEKSEEERRDSIESQYDIENEEKPLEIDSSMDKKDGSETQDPLETSTSSGIKRPSDSDSNPTPTKKVRNKPKPQTIENMKEYVDNDTTEKLTTITLIHWLKGKSVHCTTRDKKAVLIEKIKNYFKEQESAKN